MNRNQFDSFGLCPGGFREILQQYQQLSEPFLQANAAFVSFGSFPAKLIETVSAFTDRDKSFSQFKSVQ